MLSAGHLDVTPTGELSSTLPPVPPTCSETAHCLLEESQNKKCSFLTGLLGVTDPDDPGQTGGDTEPGEELPLPGLTKPPPPDTEPGLPDEELDPLDPEPGRTNPPPPPVVCELGGDGELEPLPLVSP